MISLANRTSDVAEEHYQYALSEPVMLLSIELSHDYVSEYNDAKLKSGISQEMFVNPIRETIPITEDVKWCYDHAPDAVKKLGREQVMEMMMSLYYVYKDSGK